jgi:integrase
MSIHLLSEDEAMTRIDGRYNDGGGLWLIVRNNGRAASYWFEYNGDLVGEGKRWRHVSLGPRKKTSLKKARDRAALCRSLLDGNITTCRWRNEERKELRKQKAGSLTFGEAAEQYRDWACEKIWHSPTGPAQSRGVINNYFMTEKTIWNRPILDFEVEDAAKILDPIWFKKKDMAKRVQSFGFSVFKWLKLHRLYTDENPFDGSKEGPLVQMLGGPQPPSGNFREPTLSDVKLLMAHLRKAPTHPDDVCTVAEAAEATGRDYQSIRVAIKRGLFPGAYKWAPWGVAAWLIPVKELIKVFPLQWPLRHHIEVPVPSYALQLVFLTAMREEMAANLRWDNIKTGRGLIVFQDTQHKTGRQQNDEYNVVITPTVSEILDAMEALQKRQSIKSDYVFVHPRSLTGVDYFTGQTIKRHNIWETMKRLLVRIPEIENPDATVHGVRTTFATFLT